jgi:hypothetical protein
MQHHRTPTRRRRGAVAALATVLTALLVLVGALWASSTDPQPEPARAGRTALAERGARPTSTNEPYRATSTSTTTSTTAGPSATWAAAEAVGPAADPTPPQLVAPDQPIVLPVAVDDGTFELGNGGDRPLHITSATHEGYLSVGHDDPLPDTIPPHTTLVVSFGGLAPNYNGGNAGPWQREIELQTDGGDAEIVVRGTAPVPGDLLVPVVSPPVAYPQGSSFWVEQTGPYATTVQVSAGPGLVLNGPTTFTMGLNAKALIGYSPCGRPAAAVDKVIMRTIRFEVSGHGTYETQVFFEIEAGPAEPCASQAI